MSKLKHSPSVLKALQRLIRLSSSEASHVQLGLLRWGDEILLFTNYPTMKGAPGYHFSQSYQLGLLVDLIRHFTSTDWVPTEIGIERTDDSAVPQDFLPNCRISTGRDFGYIALTRNCLVLTPRWVSEADAAGDNVPEVSNDGFDQIETLRKLIRPFLLEGYPQRRLAASLIGTSERTLNRRLAESGLTYRELIDELRFEKARSLLKETDEPVIDVAAAVGFEDPANFTRMFRRIGGVCPREFRRTRR